MTIPDDVKELFQPIKIGASQLQHRIVYAPLTRCRAINTVPIPQMAEYYAQRTTPGGLMITEATCIMEAGHGYVADANSSSSSSTSNSRPCSTSDGDASTAAVSAAAAAVRCMKPLCAHYSSCATLQPANDLDMVGQHKGVSEFAC
jgi:hypothetical protein